MKEITTPVTYRVRIETIWITVYTPKTYYSVPRALQAIKMMNLSKFKDGCIINLHHFLGEKLIGSQLVMISAKES